MGLVAGLLVPGEFAAQASCATRVPSRNQRRTRTACLRQLSARLPVRVPRRRRSSCSRLDKNSTAWSRTGSVAVYVTLIERRTPVKLMFGRTTFIPGYCVFVLYRSKFGVSPGVRAAATQSYQRLPGKAQYPDYLTDQIRPCWPNHPEARWELAWLYQLWTLAYLASRPSPRDIADWHDRWSPGVLRRLSHIMRRCEGGCQRHPGIKACGEARRRVPL
jgi:hypothetical protein